MLYELEPERFYRVRGIFKKLFNRSAIFSILDGNYPGRIFVDNIQNPKGAFVWNDWRYSYIETNGKTNGFIEDIVELLDRKLLPEARNSKDPTLAIYGSCLEITERITRGLKDWLPLKSKRSTFCFDPNLFKKTKILQREIPSGFELMEIDRNLINRFGEQLLRPLESSWKSIDDFLNKGIGFCITRKNKVVNLCFSCFVGNSHAEISIDTNPEYRRLGLATVTASHFLQRCIENSLKPGWECWADNEPSNALAKKLGFEFTGFYPVSFILADKFEALITNANHYLYELKEYEKATVFYEKAFEVRKITNANFYYYAARAYALSGNKVKAFDNLQKAIEKGWKNFHLFKNDNAFINFKNTIEWREIESFFKTGNLKISPENLD